jgi:hypothetical protein
MAVFKYLLLEPALGIAALVQDLRPRWVISLLLRVHVEIALRAVLPSCRVPAPIARAHSSDCAKAQVSGLDT